MVAWVFLDISNYLYFSEQMNYFTVYSISHRTSFSLLNKGIYKAGGSIYKYIAFSVSLLATYYWETAMEMENIKINHINLSHIKPEGPDKG